MGKHLLVTNDFPPKVGGIQQYLWELWRRLPADEITVLTTPYAGSETFDASQPYRIVRTRQKWLLPTNALATQINQLADEVGADFVVLDPAFPLGLLGPRLKKPYVLIGHGAEFVIPQRLPVARNILRKATRRASGIIGSGEYVTDSMRQFVNPDALVAVVPPGVDVERFRPMADEERATTRKHLGVSVDSLLIVGVSRLVPRKGFDRVIEASTMVDGVEVLIAGKGREAKRLQRLIDRLNAPARLLGRVDDADLPGLYAAADIFAMPCHDRWFGLEQEGYGIVFIEASSAGIPVIAGASGGSEEAVVHDTTGLVVPGSAKAHDVAAAIRRLSDPAERVRLGGNGRIRATDELSYVHRAAHLHDFLNRMSTNAS